jgi:GNAT superfamily N-acetyltransferase
MYPVLIRERDEADIQALERLAAEVHRTDGYPRYLPHSFRDFLISKEAHGAWVATIHGDLVGHVALHRCSAPEVMAVARKATGLTDQEIAVVARLLVSPKVRRAGIGRTLLNKAMEASAQRGLRSVLDVVTDHHPAVRFYQDAGWIRTDTVTWHLPDGSPLTEFVFISPPISEDEPHRT